MRAGVASGVITPPIGTMMVGYGNERRSEGVHDDLYAKALVLDDGERICALICCDLVGLHKRRIRNIRALVREWTGISEENVMVSCTHNHSGPYTWTLGEFAYAGAADEWIDANYLHDMERRIAMAAHVAVQNLTEAKIGAWRGKVEGISVNRTTPSGCPVDPELGLVRVDDARGRSLATVLNYSCHPVVLGWDNKLISADYPGALARILEKGFRVQSLFTNGACGDVNARAHGLPVKEAYEALNDVGASLTDEAAKAMEECGGGEVAQVDSALRNIDLPLEHHAREQMERKLEEKERELRGVVEEGYDDRDYHTWKVDSCMEEVAAARNLLGLMKDHIAAISTEIQVLKIADIAIAGIPGELYTEIGLSLKDKSSSKYTFISAVTNDYVGYIPTRAEFDRNQVPSMVGLTPELPLIIEDTVLEIIESLYDR